MQTRIEPQIKRARYHFDSLGEMAQYVADTRETWHSRFSQRRSDGDYWDLGVEYKRAQKLALNGWIEGAEKAQDALKAFQPATPAPDTKTDVYGFRPHVPRFCAGAPDSMIRHTNVAEMGCGRVLTLVVPINANCGTKAACMSNFGVAVAQYINQLEAQGTRVELIASFANADSKTDKRAWRVTYAITLKHADQPLDLAVIAFAIGHPAMFRRLGFALLERAPCPEMMGYGYSVHTELGDLINPPPGVVILNGMVDANTHAPTAEKGLAYVSRMIERAMEEMELAQ